MAELTDKGRRTRQRIVEATALRILDAGIDGTSLDDVRAETLTSKSQLFHYFPGGKAELVRAVAVWEGEQLLAAQEPHLSDLSTWESWAAWRRGLEEYYFDRGRWACPIGSLTAQMAAADAETAAFLREAWTSWRTRLADGVRRMQAAGHIDPGADAERLATSVLAAIQGGLLLSQPERATWPLEAALDTAWTTLHALPPTTTPPAEP
ncbi:TetR/AcrR family transcriptional regulator [uncultured Pseudokineococcus sp.]|uniref:TetR/AcrR family transcriptional regulator n=1 Tax=uncultured Pseudokineococcus sp. TaxID=1642928 RepID=UPI002613FE70|nr:TetR family transcriptional regulator C-terminal domain-containing protein [uncultured Pseudokineococcus sp.]